MMRKALSLLLLSFSMLTVAGQTNPKAGYIITLQNDTVRGTIDYRSDAQNAATCLFKPDGADSYRRYAPQDIAGYRLANEGIFYVTRTFPVDGVDKTFFAEFLLQGGVSLYRYQNDGFEHYYFVDEDGKVAQLTDKVDGYATYEEELAARRASIQEAVQFFSKSTRAVGQLMEGKVSRERLISMTRQYDEEFCTAAGDCVQFEQDTRKTKTVVCKLMVEGGVAFGKAEYEGVDFETATLPQLGVGVEAVFPRFSPAFALQARFVYTHWDVSGKKRQNYVTHSYSMKTSELAIWLGGKYAFIPRGKVSPYVIAGADIMFQPSSKIQSDSWSIEPTTNGVGFYAGGGLELKIGSHALRVEAAYLPYRSDMNGMKTAMTTLRASFVF